MEIPRVDESSTDYTPRQKEEKEEEAKEPELIAVEKPIAHAAFKTPAMSLDEKMDMYKEAADDLLDDLGDISSDEEEEEEERVERFRPPETQEVPIVPLKKEEEAEREGKVEKRKKAFSDVAQTVPPLPAALERNIKIVKKVVGAGGFWIGTIRGL